MGRPSGPAPCIATNRPKRRYGGRVHGEDGGDIVFGGEERLALEGYSYPDRSTDFAYGGLGNDTVFGDLGQGGEDRVFGGYGDDTIVVAQRGFPEDATVTKEIVDCGPGTDTVYRDKGKDVLKNCEEKITGFPEQNQAAASSRGGSGEGLLGLSLR